MKGHSVDENMKWKVYNQFAWVDSVLNSPEDYGKEVETYIKTIRHHSIIKPKTMLHLGCGAGMHDFTLKKHFKITGVDISKGMLAEARKLNPDIHYVHGDMRKIFLSETFDIVMIPDSIGYMVILQDLEKVISNANRHLNPGGLLFIVAHTREEFQENNFVYTGSKNGIHVTVFENNFILDSEKTKYEAAIMYLIRRNGQAEFFHEIHTIGLFSHETWINLFRKAGFEIKERKITDLYDRYLMENGEYTLTVFNCLKPLV